MAEPAVQQVEVIPWLKTLPLAPEFHPTLAEFQDPISYIFKIEKEASQYGICKIVPPVAAAAKKTALTHLNRSLAARAAANGVASSSSSNSGPTFTTRQQQIGFCPRKPRPVQKAVWQSGEYYTLQQFETKAKNFEKSYLKKCKKNPPSALEIESLYWKATVDKPFSVEYANDMPGSAFSPVRKNREPVGESSTVGDTAWNMRGVSRAKGSLLRFMKEEIPGVTSPMVYIAMMFSWFAWHAEDHDLHSLNYMHMGASKTWYGVPMAAANAFEEVVRVHGYGGEINPLVTFATLGEKTTMISPEVFVRAGVPCCRLVQNAGEFVITFPRAYHMGFSHGFNCAEAANIATPEWLNIAYDAAVRRASINYPPMVSHFQLLYDLAIALSRSRFTVGISSKPRSSRLKDKKKDEGEALVKDQFVQDVMQNNEMLHILGKGTPIILLPPNSSDISVCSELRVGSQSGMNSEMRFGVGGYKEALKSSRALVGNSGIKPGKGFYSMKGKFTSLCERNSTISETDNKCPWTSQMLSSDSEREGTAEGDRLSDQRLFSCVTCGILSFACVAIVQPLESTAAYLMSADCSFFNDWIGGSGVINSGFNAANEDENTFEQHSQPRCVGNKRADHIQSVDRQVQTMDCSEERSSDTKAPGNASALGLLALTYGNSSDSDEDLCGSDAPVYHADANKISKSSPESEYQHDFHSGSNGSHELSTSRNNSGDEGNFRSRSPQSYDHSVDFVTGDFDSSKLNGYGTSGHGAKNLEFGKANVSINDRDVPCAPRSDEDSSRMHVFCLKHAVEVEQQLRPIGGAHISLLCHPDYPKIVAEAKLVAEDLGVDFPWSEITFKNASKGDEEMIKTALDSEEAIPGNGDWAVKLGINLFYSANLGRSPLYSKQMPYNSVIYNAFGRDSPTSSPSKFIVDGRRPSRQKKVVAGRWCGKVWMSNQVHPFLAQKDPEEQEYEQERSFSNWVTWNENFEQKSESGRRGETTSGTRKYSRKRKMSSRGGSNKTVNCLETGDVGTGDSGEDAIHVQQGRNFRSKSSETLEGEDVYDTLEDSSHQQLTSVSRRKQVRCIEREVGVSDDFAEDDNGPVKQYRRVSRKKLAKHTIKDNGILEDLPEDGALKQYRRNPRVRHGKCTKQEDGISDESHKHSRQLPRSKQGKFIKRGDAVSDDSLEDNSHKLHGRISRRKKAKCIERDDAVSDESLDSTYKQQYRRSRHLDCIDGEDEVSDDSHGNDTEEQHRRISVGREDAVSDDSLEDTSRLQKRMPRSKLANWVRRKYAFSHDLMEDDSRRIPDEAEDEFSYDSVEDSSPFPGRRKAKERKAALSYDSLEDSTSHGKLRGRILRSQQIKTGKLDKTKPQTPRQIRTPRQPKEETEGGPSTRLRKRAKKQAKEFETKPKEKKQTTVKNKLKKSSGPKAPTVVSNNAKIMVEGGEYECDMEGCTMSFTSKNELALHKRNICPVKGCGKKFFSHKYLVQHRRVHMDDRPLKCPWKGCKMTFKWAWARTEHIRVHTGARPYVCAEPGCGQTFRFVSDFSRHKRKTGHSTKKGRG